MPQSKCEPGLHGVTIIVTEHCFASFSEDGAVDVTVMAERQKKKQKKNTAFIKTMPHHRKPCTNRTNTPPCFITAVSSHWCSHREICLDASAGSAVENSPPPPAKQQNMRWWVAGFVCFTEIFISPLFLHVSGKLERNVFLPFWGKDTHQGHIFPTEGNAFECIASGERFWYSFPF